MKNIRRFFKDYAAALTGGKPKDIAAFYDTHFLVVAPPGTTMCFRNDKKFLNWLKKIADFNKETGLEQMMVIRVNSRAVGKWLLETTVKWGAIYHKTANEIITFKIRYLLNMSTFPPRILLYASDEDQEELMREKGLL